MFGPSSAHTPGHACDDHTFDLWARLLPKETGSGSPSYNGLNSGVGAVRICRKARESWKVTVLVVLYGSGLLHAQPIINTVAGRGRILAAADGPATSLQMADPEGMTFDSAGNLYIADNQQSVVFKITPSGIATVFAGNGSKGYSGDGGPATAAGLLEPEAVAADAAGNIYIADFHNERIRKVEPSGRITTFAGGGATDEGDGIPATSSKLFEPDGLTVDSTGSLYFAEGGTNKIRKVTPDGIIHNIGNANSLPSGYSGDDGPASQAQFSAPAGLAVDRQNNLYIADRSNNRVRKIDTNGIVTTFAGNGQGGYSGDGGAATNAAISLPEALAFDSQGNLYIADWGNRVVRQVTPAGIITTVAGDVNIFPPTFSGDGGPATLASLIEPYGVAVDSSGNLYVSDQGDRRVRRVDGTGTIKTFAGSGASNFAGDGSQATQAALDYPTDVKVDGGGNLYIADAMNHRVRKVSPAGIITTIAGVGTPGLSGDGGPATSAQLNTPAAVAVDASGNVYIVDSANFRVRRVTPGGVISTYLVGTVAGRGVPAGLAVDGMGNLYVSDSYLNWVVKVTPSGTVSTVAGTGTAGYSGDGGPATQAMLNAPHALALDQAGNLYITDSQNRVIRRVTPGGLIATVAGSGNVPLPTDYEGIPATQLFIDYPSGVAADGNGNLYVEGAWHVYRVNSAGAISLLVGGGLFGYQEGFAGDGGPSVAARLVSDSSPISPSMGLAVDAAGNLYFADTGNDRIRQITNPAGFPAQMAISNPSFTWVPAPQIVPTGGDQWNFNLYPTGPNSLHLTNAGTGAMPWSATVSTLDGANWLNLSANSGSAPSTIVLSVNADGLEAGLYMGTVVVSAPDASNSPRYVSGTLQVDPSSFSASDGYGALVISEPRGTGWTVTSSADWIAITSSASGSGMGCIDYTVAANTSTTPRSGNLTLENTTQGTITFNVNQAGDLGSLEATSGSGRLRKPTRPLVRPCIAGPSLPQR
jgi:trimeric autotransporter adhesin